MRYAKPRERQFTIALYRDGTLLKQLAHLTGRPQQTISRWIRQAGAKRGHQIAAKGWVQP
jgi:transposase